MCKTIHSSCIKLLFMLSLAAQLSAMEMIHRPPQGKVLWVQLIAPLRSEEDAPADQKDSAKQIALQALSMERQYMPKFSLPAEPPQRDTVPNVPQLLVAARNGSTEFASLLLKLGDSPEVEHEGGVNALHLAAEQGHTDTVATLLDHDFAIDAPDLFGNTPLLRAAFYGRLEVVKLLVARGANKQACNEKGWYTLDLAFGNNKSEVVAWLYDNGVTEAKMKMVVTATGEDSE